MKNHFTSHTNAKFKRKNKQKQTTTEKITIEKFYLLDDVGVENSTISWSLTLITSVSENSVKNNLLNVLRALTIKTANPASATQLNT